MPSYLESITFLEQLGFQMLGLFPVTYDHDLSVVEFDCLVGRSAS
jgi:hypothetical protein